MRYTQVTDNLWRGPRPELEEFGWISSTFSTVVSLEGQAEDDKEAMDLQPVPVIAQPISFTQIYFTGISQAYLNAILARVSSAPSPVLLHCQHGEDRTGLVVAAYRVRFHGWTKQAAWLEALKFGQ